MPDEPGKSLHEIADEALVARYCQDHDPQVFAVLVGRYKLELFHFLLRFVGKRTIADELFQEVFLQVHLSADSFDSARRFKPWLFTIAANKARDHLRRHQRRQHVNLSALTSEVDERHAVDLMEADIPLPPDMADRAELQELVRQVLTDLPEPLREVLLLAYFEKLAYKEIAQMLSIPLGTVKSRLHNAVATFAEHWKAAHDDLGGQ